jgi:serine/threonine protein kinase
MDAPGKVPDSINCHSCGAILDLTGKTGFTHVECTHCGAPSVVPIQFGDYLLLNVIGIGGKGTVYKAIDVPLNRYLALKTLRKKLSQNPAFIAGFSREARAAASVNHPHVAQVYSFGELDNQYYMAMELCDRGTLDDRITKLGRIPQPEVLGIGQQIASALRAAWQRGLLHGDVKPGNILFNEDGVPKIVDFGLAHGYGKDAEEGQELPSQRQVWGTPYYVAPERLRGKPEDVRSDIYSLGATLFHALAGRPLFDVATGSRAASQPTVEPASALKTYVPTVHDHTTRVIARMLARNPDERYGSYDEVIQDLAEAQDSLKMTPVAQPVVASTGKHFLALSLFATLAMLIFGALMGWFVWKLRTIQQPATSAAPAASAETQPENVDFTKDTPWLKAWRAATLQLAQGHCTDASLGYDKALQLAGRYRQRQWIQFFQGLTLLAADHPGDANRALTRARDVTAAPGVPEVITTGNFANVLIEMMLGSIPLADVEAAIPRMPPWAAALTRFTAGFKHLDLGEFEKAAASFGEYRKLDRAREQPWAFSLQALADKYARQSDQAAATVAEIDALSKTGKYQEALAKLNAASTNANLAALKQALLAEQPDLESATAQEREKKQEEQARREAEANRAR